MERIHKYAGIASTKFSSDNFSFVIEENIMNPTKRSAGDVAHEGMVINNGAKEDG